MKITKIIGTTYLCSKFTNHDGTIVSDHPLYLFETDNGKWLGVMFTQKTNPFTAKWPDGNDITFKCCSNHQGEYPTRKVFQAELYIIDPATIKCSEYTFNLHAYNEALLKALKNALKSNAITSVHPYNSAENVENQDDILSDLKNYVDLIVEKCYYNKCPVNGIANTSYNEFKKIANTYDTRKENHRVWKNKQ